MLKPEKTSRPFEDGIPRNQPGLPAIPRKLRTSHLKPSHHPPPSPNQTDWCITCHTTATRDPIQSLKLPVFKTNKTLSNIRNPFIALPSGSVCYSSHKRSLSRRWLMGDTGRSLLINEVKVEVEDRVEAGHTFWKSF